MARTLAPPPRRSEKGLADELVEASRPVGELSGHPHGQVSVCKRGAPGWLLAFTD